MPNWCTNEVTVTGDEDKVEEFRKYVEGEYYHGKCADSFKWVWDEKREKGESVAIPDHCNPNDDFKETCDKRLNEFSFRSIIPMPPELEHTTSPVDVYETQADIDAYLEELKTHDNYDENNGYYKSIISKAITREYSDYLIKTFGANNWYDWAYDKWGTKWDVNEIWFEDQGGGFLRYEFDTAWSPPEPICAFLKDKFPEINISWFYREEGMEMAGYL